LNGEIALSIVFFNNLAAGEVFGLRAGTDENGW